MKNHFVANCYGIRRGKVLLGFHKKEGKWLPLGGHIKSGETPEEAVRREFREESGLQVEFLTGKEYSSGKIKSLHQPQKMNLVCMGDHPLHINLIYFCRVKKGGEKISEREHRKLRWFSKGDIEKERLDADVRLYAKEAIGFVSKA
ncbi:MAG: NUDIX domain-containing protein [Candidatus Aenigmarchaeota archaeon]|nr:NUDIX domain-containing protein [Candidatus Aenigmarchaeota archaeon]